MKIGKREKKAFILGGIGLILILSYLLCDWFIDYKKDLSLKKDAKKLQLSHLIGKIAEKGETEKKIVDAKKELEEAEKKLIPGDKPAVGAAELQKILKDMASSSRIDIRSERILTPTDMNPYSTVSVEIAFVATTAKFRDLIYKIETSPFLLVIPDAKIRVTNIKNPTDIQVNLTVKGFMKKSSENEKKEVPKEGSI